MDLSFQNEFERALVRIQRLEDLLGGSAEHRLVVYDPNSNGDYEFRGLFLKEGTRLRAEFNRDIYQAQVVKRLFQMVGKLDQFGRLDLSGYDESLYRTFEQLNFAATGRRVQLEWVTDFHCNVSDVKAAQKRLPVSLFRR